MASMMLKVTVDSNHQSQRLLKVTVDCNQRLQLISKVEIFSNQWFRWSKKGASYGLMPPSLFLLRLCLLLLHKKWESESAGSLICIIFAPGNKQLQ